MPTLEWIGKSSVVGQHHEVPYHLLQCDHSLSVGEQDAGNLLVQGDNLLGLKALLPYYAGKVKCIYIDPPYNTGQEGWVYNDNVDSPNIRRWLGEVVGKEGDDLTRHDKWLCMMYPRLALLREFLTQDGLLFVSIDDNEAASLRLLLDELFGRNRFLATFVWKRRTGAMDAVGNISEDHEYVHCYTRATGKLRGVDKSFARYTNDDDDPRGPWIADNLSAGKPGGNTYYAIKHPETGEEYWPPKGRYWPYSPETMNRKIAEGRIIFPKKPGGSPLVKRFQYEAKSTKRPVSTWIVTPKEAAKHSDESAIVSSHNSAATRTIKQLFDDKVFNYSKPVDLIQSLVEQSTDRDSIVLDSFAGSGTTGHAVLAQNKADRGSRRFICIEMEETICRNVTAPRLQKVSKGYTNSKGTSVEGLGGGFRLCTLGAPLFDETGNIGDDVGFSALAAHVFFTETGSPAPKRSQKINPLIGVHQGKAVYLLFNGVLGDKRPNGGNVLTHSVAQELPKHPAGSGPRVVYGEASRLGAKSLASYGITFKQIPYELKAD